MMNLEQGKKNYYDRPRYAETRKDFNPVRERIPHDAIERRYVTEYLKEVAYLSEKGIRPVQSIVKRDWGVRQYKYIKTSELFAALHEFWKKESAEREFRRADRELDRATKDPDWIQ